MTQLKERFPVKVGRGQVIHAGEILRTEKKGRHSINVYKHLCSSGDGCYLSGLRSTSVQLDSRHKLTDVNCKKCLRYLQLYG